jgi:hypothetical protein
MIEVEFTVDFATKLKGDKWLCDSLLASHLVNVDKVAKYSTVEQKKLKEVKIQK